MHNQRFITGLIMMFSIASVFGQYRQLEVKVDVPLDSIRLSDPCILADAHTSMYYMTGTGGLLWKSYDLRKWTGPYRVAETDPDSWMGPRPMIWAAELHAYKGKYYYFATFTNRDVKIDTVKGNVIERRASHVLVSGTLDGPWMQEEEPITPPNFGHGMMFRTFEGKLLMCLHSHKNVNGRYVRIPHLFEVDDSGDKIIVGQPY